MSAAIANPSGCCRNIDTACCPGPMPDVLYAAIIDRANCGCADGVSIALPWNGVAWVGEGSVCGVTWQVALACISSSFELGGAGPTGCTLSPQTPDLGWSCSPINLVFSRVPVNLFCMCEGGPLPTEVSITVTE
jgi:hypothetical protein